MSEPAEKKQAFVFEGFDSPNTTQVPDAFFDVVAPELSEAELRVALYIIRRTFGFKKDSDDISLRQMVEGITTKGGRVLDRGTGLKKSAVANALNGLERKGVIVSQRNRSRERGNEPTTYALNLKNHPLSVPVDKGLSIHTDKPLSVPVDTQHTVEQHTVIQETEYSNRFELQTQEFNETQTSSFSKKRDNFDKNGALEAEPPTSQRRGQSRGLTPIADALSTRALKLARRSPKTAKNPPSAPKGDSKTGPSSERAPRRPRGRPKKYDLPPDLELFTRDITAEFHDVSKLPSNLSFIGRVLKESGLTPSYLYQLMQEARQLTKGRGDIDKPSADDPGFRNRFPYFRRTLIDLIEKAGRPVSARRNDSKHPTRAV